MPAFTPFFVGDFGKPDSKLAALLDQDDLRSSYAAYQQEEQRQKAAVPESELQEDARELLKILSDHWAGGVYAVMGLADLLVEKQRRLREAGEYDVSEKLAAWLEGCLRPDDDPYLVYAPDARDCHILVTNVAGCGDDGLGRPDFIDIAGDVLR
jgi:hypothetical protein